MDLRRGRRPIPLPFWRRALIASALLVLTALGSVAAAHSTGAPQSGVLGVYQPAPPVTPTPEDDVGGFVDPTAPSHSDPVEAAQLPRGGAVVIPVLLYHYVRVNPVATDQVGFELSVTPPNFAQQMGFLQSVHAHTLSLADVSAALQSGKPLPPRSVVLTFDDGYADFARVAAPVMQYDGLHGTVFVVSGFVGRNGYMNATQVRQVQEMGMVIGVHTVNHVDLSHVPPPIAATQISVSHRELDALTGRHLLDFAYPYGGFDPAVERLVLADGFRDAVTTQGGATLAWSQRSAWPRYHVGGSDTLFSFAHKALYGMPTQRIDAMVHAFLDSPSAALALRALPAKPAATALGDPVGEDSRRYL
jgi:peptidoglycan/xylan/chitin deacetylase (PgdA/CDA1 family)